MAVSAFPKLINISMVAGIDSDADAGTSTNLIPIQQKVLRVLRSFGIV